LCFLRKYFVFSSIFLKKSSLSCGKKLPRVSGILIIFAQDFIASVIASIRKEKSVFVASSGENSTSHDFHKAFLAVLTSDFICQRTHCFLCAKSFQKFVNFALICFSDVAINVCIL
jgi:hypothetical protein